VVLFSSYRKVLGEYLRIDQYHSLPHSTQFVFHNHSVIPSYIKYQMVTKSASLSTTMLCLRMSRILVNRHADLYFEKCNIKEKFSVEINICELFDHMLLKCLCIDMCSSVVSWLSYENIVRDVWNRIPSQIA
jgi:hypothetical protein